MYMLAHLLIIPWSEYLVSLCIVVSLSHLSLQAELFIHFFVVVVHPRDII